MRLSTAGISSSLLCAGLVVENKHLIKAFQNCLLRFIRPMLAYKIVRDLLEDS